MSTYYVYGLRARGTGAIRYIGVSKNPRGRLYQHKSPSSNSGNQRLSDWLSRNDVELVILDQTEGRKNGRRLEEKWMRAYRAMGADLLNQRVGLRSIMSRTERTFFLSRWFDKYDDSRNG